MLISGYLQPIPDLSPVIPSADETSSVDPTVSPYDTNIISFYKTWDPYGAFSNFSPHPIEMPDENGDYVTWRSVEHYYQVFSSVLGVCDDWLSCFRSCCKFNTYSLFSDIKLGERFKTQNSLTMPEGT